MNARQKAKKYKKELDRLRSSPIKPQIVYEARPITTIQASIVEEPKLCLPPKEFIRKHLIEQICRSGEFTNAVNIESEYNDWTGWTKYTATLQIVGR